MGTINPNKKEPDNEGFWQKYTKKSESEFFFRAKYKHSRRLIVVQF